MGLSLYSYSQSRKNWFSKFFINYILRRYVIQDMERMEELFKNLKDDDIEIKRRRVIFKKFKNQPFSNGIYL